MHKGLIFSIYSSLAILVIGFFILNSIISPLIIIAATPLLFIFVLVYYLNMPRGWIRMRQRELEKEVLFAGRYLLVKLESGTPLFNALIDASRSYGVSSEYFKEIVDQINAGMPIEEALEEAREYSASDMFRKLLWQLVSTIETGTEVTSALRSTLNEITAQQMIEIKEYGKKLNSLLMFYMILACVLPSIGVSMFVVIASFLQLQITQGYLFFVAFMLCVMQMAFIIIIRSMRPMVNL